jgi:hypothetical protein
MGPVEDRGFQFPIPDIRVPQVQKPVIDRALPIPPVLRQKLVSYGWEVTPEAWNDFIRQFPPLPSVNSFLDVCPITA